MSEQSHNMGLEAEMAAPLHLQRLERSLNIQPFIDQVNVLFEEHVRLISEKCDHERICVRLNFIESEWLCFASYKHRSGMLTWRITERHWSSALEAFQRIADDEIWYHADKFMVMKKLFSGANITIYDAYNICMRLHFIKS